MATLTIPNSFVAGTPALASEVNANFTAIENWSLGQIGPDNFSSGWTQGISFILPTGNAISIQNNGDNTPFEILQRELLNPNQYCFLIDDNQSQTALGAAQLKLSLAAGSTIPAIHVTHAAVDTFKLTKDYLRLEAILKPPVRTISQRNAISSPEEGSVIYNSTTAQLNEKRSDGWAAVGSPVGSVQMFAGSSAPDSWLLCDGSTLDSVANPKYASLFAVIGTTYGGTGAADFKVPDCRGIFVRGVGSQTIGAKTYAGVLGTAQNDATSVNGLTTSSAGSHNHGGATGSSYVYFQNTLSGAGATSILYTANFYNTNAPFIIPGSLHSHTISSDGSHTHSLTGDTETRPANIALNYIIKY